MPVGVNLPISGLPAASLPLVGGEPLPLVQGGVTRQVPASAFARIAGSLVNAGLGNNFPATQLARFTDSDHLIALHLYVAMTTTNPAGGLWNVDVTWTDNAGAHSSLVAQLDASGNGDIRFNTVECFYLRRNTSLSLQTSNFNPLWLATYQIAAGVEVLF